MENWENGRALVERGEIIPDDGSSTVRFKENTFEIISGKVKFRRSASDPNWAEDVIQREPFDKLLESSNMPIEMTPKAFDLIAAEIASFVAAAKRAPSTELEKEHLKFARKRLSCIGKDLCKAPGRPGVKMVRKLLVKKR